MNPMHEKRRYHGMNSINDTVSVFGGRDASKIELKTCEKFEKGNGLTNKKNKVLMEDIYIRKVIFLQ